MKRTIEKGYKNIELKVCKSRSKDHFINFFNIFYFILLIVKISFFFFQRYMANEEFYEEGGPLFIHVGGEWTISPGSISSGHMYDMAKENKAYLCYTEHRYYGKSRPVR